jgi:hypothetical protein
MRLIEVPETAVDREANKILPRMSPRDLSATFADIDAAARDLEFLSRYHIEGVIEHFVRWFGSY